VIAETRSDPAARAATRFGADLVSTRVIAQLRADIFAPCALGGVLDVARAATLQARVVCGAANNQLAVPEVGEMLAARGVIYAPDFLVNAGGIINVAAEYLGWSQAEVAARVDAIASRLTEVLDLADACGVSPARAAAIAAQQAIGTTGHRSAPALSAA